MTRRPIAAHPILAFLFVAFGWTWACDLIFYSLGWWGSVPLTFPRQWGVPLGAAVAVWASEESVREWLRRILDPRVRPVLYLLAVLVPLLITQLQPVVRAVGGGSLAYDPPAALPLIALFWLVNAFLLGGIEEVGWRGFLQPQLQSRRSVLGAGLLVGIAWWAWHLPLFLGHPNYALEPLFLVQYTLFLLGSAVFFAAFVNLTGGRVLPLMFMHAAVNVGPLLAGGGGPLDAEALVGLVVGSGLWWLLVAVLALAYGRRLVPDGTLRRVRMGD